MNPGAVDCALPQDVLSSKNAQPPGSSTCDQLAEPDAVSRGTSANHLLF